MSEFVVLEDGRKIVLDRRGFTLGDRFGPVNEGLTEEIVRQQVLNVVLPDDDLYEDDHPWEWLAERARNQAVDVTAEALKELPYEVVLADGVNQWLSDN